jgi:UDP-glucose 4-epimerase
MAMTEEVLVTGGCGFIGRHLVRRLLAEGRRVTILDDFSTGLPHLLPADPLLSIRRGCVTDAEAVGAAARGVTTIYHLAAVVGQVNVSRAPGWAMRVSTESMLHLNRCAPDALLVLFSSSAVYGLAGNGLCREDQPPDEAGVLAYDGGTPGYAFGKYRSETLAAERASGRWLAVRPFNVIGPGQRGNYGMVVPRFLRCALEGEPVTVYGDGTQSRSFGDVDAFVGHLLRLVRAWRVGQRRPAVFNIGSRAETSIDALAATIERVLGRSVVRRYRPYHEVYPGKRDVLRRRPSLERIEAMLGPLDWPPLERVIERMLGEPVPEFLSAPAAPDATLVV